MTLQLGDVVDGKYRIVRLIGEGGMGAVYEGENTRIHRRVAIKVLHAAVAESQDAVQRFEREAQAAGRIGSEHIVEVLDLGILDNGDRYMVMEFLEGQSLSDRIEALGRLHPQDAAPIVIQLLDGLHAAHEAGIIHRDLKPDNVFLLANRGGKRDFVKILDFGISKFNTLGNEFSMTRTGAVMGTPYYMSPEQAKGSRNIDQKVDIYAVGVILYEAVCGEVPFNAETFNELLFKIVLETPPPLAQKIQGLDPAFAAIVEKAMARDTTQRYQTAHELKHALQAWLAGAPAISDSTLSQGTPSAVAQTERPPLPTVSEQAPAAVGQKTQGTWSASGVFPGHPAKSPNRTALWAGLAVGLLALGGGGVYALSSNAEKEAEALAQRAEEEKAAAALQAEELRLEAERARAEAEAAKAEQARLLAQASETAAATEKQRLEEARLEAERLEQEKREEAARLAARAAARKAASTSGKSSNQDGSSPSSSPGSSSNPGGGRVIRTDL